MTENEFSERMNNLTKDVSSNKLIIESIKWVLIDKENKDSLVVSIVFSIILSITVTLSQNTVIIFKSVISDFFDVLLVMFGVVFTAFALLQAYVNTNILKSMVPLTFDKKDENSQSDYSQSKFSLHIANENFTYLLILTLINILIILFLKILLKFINPNFMIFSNILLSNICCSFLLSILFTSIIDNIILVKSIVRDLYMLFNLGTGIAILQIVKDRDKK
nr:hypothetical protein [uncultured Faecalibacillus sp.]